MNKAMLMILDGWGVNKSKHGNAVVAAKTPNLDKMIKDNPHNLLEACGLSVGLPENTMGNSEVGHLNIGAGRTVFQLNTMIDKEIEQGSFYMNEALCSAVDHAKKNGSKLHLMGLFSNGNVHSFNKHLWELLRMAKLNMLDEVYLHAFMDGRDTLPNSGFGFMQEFLEKAKEIKIGKVATIIGRYYVMDRDNRWDRVEKAYDALVNGKGVKAEDPLKAIQNSYDEKVTDEFILPCVMQEDGKPVAKIEENDAVIFFNFRADRAREITRSFIYNDFAEFPTTKFKNLKYVTFNQYDVNYGDKVEVAFRLPELTNILGQVVAENGGKQLRIAETEKYAHVTFFFNGGKEVPNKGEERILVPSPKVATYDLQPEMSAYEVKDKLKAALLEDKFDLVIVNFANCDMVGHTGVFDAVVKAVETVDACVGELLPVAKEMKYNVLVTADHGNAEKLLDENENVFTAHTTNPVPLIIITADGSEVEVKKGILGDIAPTILKLMDLEIPEDMTGKVLI